MAKRRRKSKTNKTAVIVVAVFLLIIILALGLTYAFYSPFREGVQSLFSRGEVENPDNSGEDNSGNTDNSGKTDDSGNKNENGDGQTDNSGDDTVYSSGELSVHFLELGSYYTGDCTLIDIGETEILIDAGSRKGSAATIVPYVQNYCSDGTIEYCIVTHAHQDHIAGFVGTSSAAGVFESFAFGTIIDFSMHNTTSQIYNDYVTARDEAVGRGAKHYTALECWNNENGASRTYEITDEITLSVLYNYYYENTSSSENNYSVCVLLTYGGQNFLFTGDAELEAEEYLVQYNDLPQCVLYKAGHHGSKTSSNNCLLSVIKPEIVCVCCCAGSSEYTDNNDNKFPTQAFCDRVGKYTDKIYVTTMVDDDEKKTYKSMNGNIVVKADGKNIEVTASNNTTILKDTEWFKENRVWNGV